MAWVAEENFNSYAAGDNWNTANGGSGWSGAWAITDTGQEYDIVSTPTLEGVTCAHTNNANGGGTGNADRTLTTAVTTGTVYYLVRKDAITANEGIRVVFIAGVNEYWVRFFGDDITIGSTSGNVNLETVASANTTYEIAHEFNTATPEHRAKYRVQGGGWSAWTSWVAPSSGAGTTSIASISIQHLGTDTAIDCFVDRISASEESSLTGVMII